MSQVYQTKGIILKGKPFGEADRLLTILTPEYGLIQAIAPDARKHNSKLRGRSEIFVVNDLLLTKGRSLDKISQAETITSYPGLSQNFGKLIAGQYLAELTLYLALSEQSQEEIFEILNEHLRRLEQITITKNQHSTPRDLFPHLTQGVFHLLAIAGICPQVYQCCISQTPLKPDFEDPTWQVGFSFEAGGLINLAFLAAKMEKKEIKKPLKIHQKLGVIEVTLLQQLAAKTLVKPQDIFPDNLDLDTVDLAWIKVEKILRDYLQNYLNCKFRSTLLLDSLVKHQELDKF